MSQMSTVIVIDDDAADQYLHERLIRKTGAARDIICFGCAAKALSFLENADQRNGSLILLDINMPGMTGLQFLEELELRFSGERYPAVVILTASLDPRNRIWAQRFEKVKGFVNKPLTSEHLQEMSQYLDEVA